MLGFAIGGLIAAEGLLRSLTLWILQPVVSFLGDASLPTLLGLGRGWIIAGSLLIIGLLLKILPRPSLSGKHWSWRRTGLAIGLLGTLAWIVGAPTGWHWGLSMTGPSRTLLGMLVNQSNSPMTWGAFMLLGVPVGSWLSAWSKGNLEWWVPEARELARRFLGGLLMGIGGTVAGGCNIGNALTGVSVFALNSLVATVSIVFGVALADRVGDRTSTVEN